MDEVTQKKDKGWYKDRDVANVQAGRVMRLEDKMDTS
jgi:hypothetical protein